MPDASRVGGAFPTSKYELVRTYVAVVADVTVDRTTGAIKVDRVLVVHDCGQIINPTACAIKSKATSCRP